MYIIYIYTCRYTVHACVIYTHIYIYTAIVSLIHTAKGFMYMTVQLDRCSICSYHVTKAYDRVGSFRIKKSRCSA